MISAVTCARRPSWTAWTTFAPPSTRSALDIEGRYPLTLGAIEPEHIRGDDGYAVDYVIHADRVGPMSFLDVCGLEIFIKERTGLNVLVHTHPIAETARAAAE